MVVYYIISYDIIDAEAFSLYPVKALPLIQKYGGEVLVSDTEATVIEGKSKTMNAVVKFPSPESALKCYNDPEYRQVAKIRWENTNNCTMVLAKGIE